MSAAAPTDRRFLTPPQIAKRLGVAVATVRGWITRGELKSMNVARRECSRPRFRVDPIDLEIFNGDRPARSPRRHAAAKEILTL